MATSDVTFQDGFKHPYLLALVRWCLSSFWSTANIILHRLITAPLPQIKAPKPPKSRPASYDHLHPEPRVDCEVLHTPSNHTLDVIFVHGLYGSLGNTWRQGEWQTKYEKGPTKVPLRRPHSIPTCICTDGRETCSSYEKRDDFHQTILGKGTNRINEPSVKEANQIKDENVYDDTYSRIRFNVERSDIIRQENLDTKVESIRCFEESHKLSDGNEKSGIEFRIAPCSIPESDRISNVIQTDYEKGEINAGVNKELYSNIQKILPKENLFITEKFYNNTLLDDIADYETQAQFVKDLFKNSVKVKSDCECKKVGEYDDVKADDCKCEVKCEAGCGCICDECYSPCWPRDWIKADYPGARVISINYTSDPYLWRPLWVKESKRLRLHERAEQMMSQLLDLGVGERPIIWVGHSKGGLFTKKIYCEAYEAHLKITKQRLTKVTTNEQNMADSVNNNKINHLIDKDIEAFDATIYTDVNLNVLNEPNDQDDLYTVEKCKTFAENSFKSNDSRDKNRNDYVGFENNEERVMDHKVENDLNGNIPYTGDKKDDEDMISEINEADLSKRARLWSNSAGFMFYSVPHRGSPLADIKTPITARSIELMEICKDCPLVLSLQDAWSVASGRGRPAVRSLVETCRTLMSVLYLRIVSVDSADPGMGALNGVDVDHREICKPSSRSCLLYRELMTLMEMALGTASEGMDLREFDGKLRETTCK